MNVSDPVPDWVQQAADSNTHVRTIHLAFSGPLDEGHYESLRFETSAQDLVPVERIVNLQPLDEVFGVLNPSNKRGAYSIAKPQETLLPLELAALELFKRAAAQTANLISTFFGVGNIKPRKPL